MEVIVKEGSHKIDPKNPAATDPKFKRRKDVGEQHWKNGKMKFENDAQERDYLKKVESNPANQRGLPIFFPPLQIAPSHGFGDGCKTETLPCGKRWRKMLVRNNQIVYQCPDGHEFDGNNNPI
jgi:hypothetical protein